MAGTRRTRSGSRWASEQTIAHAAQVLAPLNPAESKAATELALRAVVTAAATPEERLTVFPAQLRIEKPAPPDGSPSRLISVRIRDRDRGVVHEIAVARGTVVAHDVNERAWPNFSDEERFEALRILRGHAAFGKLLDRKTVDVEWFSPGHGPERLLGARLVSVRGNRVIDALGEAVIDLDREAIVEGRHRDG